MAMIARPATGEFRLSLGLGFAFTVSVGNVIDSVGMRTPREVADKVPIVWMLIGLWALDGRVVQHR
jgi:hypothetical protein